MKRSFITKIIAVVCVMIAVLCLTACGKSDASGWTVAHEFNYTDIATWSGMKTPVEGSGCGSVAATDDASGFVTIQAAADGWGGVESEYIEIDLTKDPVVLAKVFECPDGSNWGMKVLPENAIEGHEWGLYIVPDNTMKWNCYGGANLKDALGEDFAAIYGDQCKVKIWIYPAGGPEATVSVSEILVLNTK